MSFHLYNGNDLEALADKFAALFLEKADPFAEDTIITMEPSLRRWLSVFVARRKGFFPAAEWMSLGDFIYKYLFNPAQGKRGDFDKSKFEPKVTVWQIYNALKDMEHPRISGYIRGDDLRRWQLATKMSEIFDRYMTYRSEYLAAWEAGKTIGVEETKGETWPDEAWQADLWRKIVGDREDTFSALCRKCLGKASSFHLENPHGRRFFYFGIATMPLMHILAAKKVAENDEVYFFMINPCASLWDDVKSKRDVIKEWAEQSVPEFYDAYIEKSCNTLLGNMALYGRDYFATMVEEAWNHSEDDVFYSEDKFPETALGWMRRDVQNNENNYAEKLPSDHSIAVHACYSPMREVEVLKDQILLAFKEEKNLRPMDVRVYVADIEAYEPFIEAVFGDAEDEKSLVPYRIVGRSFAREYPEFKVFGQLLDLLKSRFKASAVVEFISSEPVLQRFGLDADDASRLRELVVAANAAWGLDGDHKNSLGGAKSDRNSWKFAIDRLVLGVACSEPEEELLSFGGGEKYMPESSAEGQMKVVGVLSKVMDLLEKAHEEASGEKTAYEWSESLRKWMDAFLPERGGDGIIELRRLLASLPTTVEDAKVCDMKMPFAVVKAWFNANMKEPKSAMDAVSGKVTFAPFPTSDVALPARVVGFLGLNDGAFPARDRREGYNLILKRHKVGDPSNRGRDRYAFLQTLMSAKDRVIITYTGFSHKDKSVMPPSIVVSELIDTLKSYYTVGNALHKAKEDVGNAKNAEDKAKTEEKVKALEAEEEKAIRVVHPLHPFSKEYFTADETKNPLLVSFAKSQADLAKAIQGKSTTESKPIDYSVDAAGKSEADEIDLESVISAFKDPAKYFITQTIGASAKPMEEKELLDAEPTDMDSLARYNLFSDVIKAALLAGADKDARLKAAENTFHCICADGGTPMGTSWDSKKKEFEDVLDAIPNVEFAGPESKRVELGGKAVRARFQRLWSSGGDGRNDAQLIVHPSSKVNGGALVEGLLRHLAFCAAQGDVTTKLVARGEQKEFHSPGSGTEGQQKAQELLAKILEYYEELRNRPICFDPAAFGEAIQSREDEPKREDYQRSWHAPFDFPNYRKPGVSDCALKIFTETITDAQASELHAIGSVFAETYFACTSANQEAR